MSANLYIPKKLKVGFQNRTDTFTKKLAFVVYEKEDGTTFLERTWNSWCDDKITKVDYENKPARFVLNKGVQRYGSFGSGRSVIRIYDQRDFEFEISVDNLMALLMYSDVSKRDIEQECVFAWNNRQLVLIPTNSEEYQEAIKHTNKQGKSVDKKDLVEGYTYNHKKEKKELVYIGHHYWGFGRKAKDKKYVFFNGETFEGINPAQLSECIDSTCHPEYANYKEQYLNSMYCNEKISGFVLAETPILGSNQNSNSSVAKEIEPGKFLRINFYSYSDIIYYLGSSGLSGTVLSLSHGSTVNKKSLYSYYHNNLSSEQQLLKDLGERLFKDLTDEGVFDENGGASKADVIRKLKEYGYKHLRVVVNDVETDYLDI